MARITFTVSGEVQLDRSIERFADAIRDWRRIWPNIEDKVYEIEQEQFATRGHGAWAPLSPAYAAWKAAHYPGQPILVRTGRMRSIFTGQEKRIAMDRRNLRFFGIDYWEFHQRGTRYMPQRKVIHLREQDKTAIMKVVQRGIMDEAARAGLLRYRGNV